MFQDTDKKTQTTSAGQRFLDAVQSSFWAEYRQFPLWIVVIFACGILIYDQYFIGTDGAIFVLAVICFIGGYYLFKHSWICGMCLLGLMLSCGAGGMALRTETLKAPALTEKIGPVLVMGSISQVDVLPNNERRIYFDSPFIEDIPKNQSPEKVRLKVKAEFLPKTEIKAGDNIMVMAMLMPASKPVMAGGFDFERYAYFQKIGAHGYAVENILMRPEHHIVPSRLTQLKHHLRISLTENINDPNHTAIALALLLGDKKAVPDQIMNLIRTGGIAHLLAISGLHIGLIAAMFFITIRQLLVMTPYVQHYWPVKELAYLTSFAILCFYVALVGAPVSAIRALLMVGLVMVALWLGRRALTVRLVSFTALVILALMPEMLYQPSFQMSFSAVLGLVAFYESTHDWWQKQYQKTGLISKIYLYFMGALATTIIASLATAPVAMYHFQQVSLINGLMVNLIAVPLVGFVILPLGVLGVFLSFAGAEAAVFSVMGDVIGVLMWFNQWVIEHGVDMWHMPAMSPVAFLFWALGFLCLCLWRGWLRILMIPCFACALLLDLSTLRPDILIADQGQLWAVHDPDERTLLFNHKRGNDFVRDQWRQRFGVKLQQSIKTIPNFGGKTGFYCDDMACRLERGHVKISILHLPDAMAEECLYADLVLVSDAMMRRFDGQMCAANLYEMKKTSSITIVNGSYKIEEIN